jgi:hypothetical protein
LPGGVLSGELEFRRLLKIGQVDCQPLVLAFALGIVTCARSEPAAKSPRPRAAKLVEATILANGCTELGQKSAHQAETAMYQLIEACDSVPGGRAKFEATLQPGGKIDIAGAGGGQPDVVPICVLKHSLAHSVKLTKPCRLDVKIEQTSVAMGADAGVR